MTLSVHDRKREVVVHPNDAGARHSLAEGLFEEGDVPGAIAQLEKAIALDHSHIPSRRLLARAYARDQRLSQARRLLEETVRAFPDRIEVRDELIEMYLEQRRLDDALIHTAEATRILPSDAQRWATHGSLLAQHLLWEPAHDAMQTASKLAPDDRVIAKDLELIARERAQANGDDARADVLTSAEVLASAELKADNSALAQAATRLGAHDLQGAKRLLVTATTAERATAAFSLVRAEILFNGDDFVGADQALGKALELRPRWVLAERRRGDVAMMARRFPDARAHYGAALKLAPDDLSIKSALRRVDVLAAAMRPSVEGRRGRISVLAWNVVGGNVSPLQAVLMPGKGDVFISGNVGESIRESARLAFSLIRARAREFDVEGRGETKDLHYHIVDTDKQKDGASAGLAFTLAALSALHDRDLPEGFACTGEITLAGDVRAIAGVREKVVAAYLSGCRTVMLPRKNLRDAQDLPPEVTTRLRLVYVDSAFEAYGLLFTE